MTSKGEAQETSEFLRRRQLRLQQVREQSKDIAKKIRQRAKVEQLRQVVELEDKKERDYKKCQDKFVKKLEELYSRGLDNVGSGHKQAHGLSPPVNLLEKFDLSHLRGKEAAAEVKRQKQQKLDELKKSLDRKVQAREAANVLSREKSASASNKLSIKASSNSNKKHVNEATKKTSENVIENQDLKDKESVEQVSRIDMGTQWDIDLLPPEWEPNVPALAIAQDDDNKHSEADKDNSTEKQKKTNLFALSDEMPSSLRGGVANHCDTGPTKLSSTLVSEYIQNRVLRLREPEVTSSKQHSEDLQNLRQTIIRSRPLRPEGSDFRSICHVVEGQVYPVPSWHPETSCYCQSPRNLYRRQQSPEQEHFSSVTHSNKVFGSFCPVKRNLVSSAVSEMTRPLIPHKCFGHNELSVYTSKNGSVKGKGSDNLLTKKKSVTTYNHSTRDSRDVPLADERVVQRDRDRDGDRAPDAYARALGHAAPAPAPAPPHDAPRRTLLNTNKIAVTRQNVEKEYKDTMTFLNNLPKNKNSRPINNAFKEDYRLLAQKENRQRILQQEFKNIEEESRRQYIQGNKSRSRFPEKSPPKRSKSPSDLNVDNLNERDFSYSWMPVPESDSKLAVHAIPSGARGAAGGGGGGGGAGGARGRSDCYHEYRSRHKHTPPTRDVGAHHTKRKLQTVVFQDNDSETADSQPSEDSSTESRHSDHAPNNDNHDSTSARELTDTERIIIYKILNHKHRKKSKTNKVNSTDNVVESRDGTEGAKNTENGNIVKPCSKGAKTKAVGLNDHVAANSDDPLSVGNHTEGIYEVTGDNQDNLESLYNAELVKNSSDTVNKGDKRNQGLNTRSSDAGDGLLQPRKKCTSAKCKNQKQKGQSTSKPPPSTSEKPATWARDDCPQPAGLLKLMDEQQKQESNFYIGATGFLKHDAYEVIIHLRKNDTPMTKDIAVEQKTSDSGSEIATNTKTEGKPSASTEHIQQKQSDGCINSEPIPQPCSGTDQASAHISATNSIEDHKEKSVSKATSVDVQPTKTMLDRSVSTSFKDLGYTETPLPEPSTKSDPIPRAATSACTQTTPSPPNPRPVYIHMSSSTSTAYMSPPEVVLPNFFRRGDKSCRKGRRHSRNVDKHEESNLTHREHHCKKYSSCKIFEKISEPKADRLNFHADIYREKQESTLSSSVSQRKNRCPKYKTRVDCEICCRQHSRKMKEHLNTDKQKMSMWNAKSAVMHSKKNKTNAHSGKSYLSPMIKEYIHKLLSLNREGIKAIQIINQDCSSVNTPASSIINVPTNVSNKNYRHNDLNIPSQVFSLEQFKSVLKQHIVLHNNATLPKFTRAENTTKGNTMITRNTKSRKRNSKNKRLHKVKSLNISKKLVIKPSVNCTDGQTKVNSYLKKRLSSVTCSQDSSPSDHIKNNRELGDKNNILITRTISKDLLERNLNQCAGHESSSGHTKGAFSLEEHSHDSNDGTASQPINISTQTSRTADGEMNFIKLAEDKLQNMEKIADLTEKCTKRLSNLAKVLEEVRKNKSLAYSQVSNADSTSDSDQKSDKAVTVENEDLKTSPTTNTVKSSQIECNVDSTDYEFLVPSVSIPTIKFPEIDPPENVLSDNSNNMECISKSFSEREEESRITNTRCRNKPPPAMLRIHLKRPQDNVVPHELSTVIEVDSPLSVKHKQHSSTINANQSANIFSDSRKVTGDRDLNPDSAPSIDDKYINDKMKVISSDSSEDSKLQMMDLNQFNEIMLRPFVSLQEYAREHYDMTKDTKCNSISKDIGLTEDISSLHSDGSLPDVVAELLKRKLITEPFRFDTASNVNSTTISSESTLSALALSKVRKDRHKSKLAANKENVGETSDSLSISSNPDLENAFKKLGMGWASSTLKKTKERLALSSSSNTSSSSLSQIKFKSLTKQDELLTDAGWALPSLSKKPVLKRRLDVSKNVEQQTSFSNNMTVKEFLTKELAKKITFTDKSTRDDTNQEFVSLIETKLPDNLKNSSQTMLDENSGDSAPSGNNNRARTSTPVKLFKSMTYHSSSSSNVSNGLFSNADDLSSVKLTSASLRGPSASEKDELTIPNCSLKMRKTLSDCSKTDSC